MSLQGWHRRNVASALVCNMKAHMVNQIASLLSLLTTPATGLSHVKGQLMATNQFWAILLSRGEKTGLSLRANYITSSMTSR